MARPTKIGLDYFPLDVDMDQDDKIFYIETKYGPTGFAVIIKLFMRIYKNGYYCNWGEKEQLMFSRKVNVDINTLSDIINDCINEGLFDKNVYEKYGVLTSKGIQNRFLEACSRRKKVIIDSRYLVADINQYSNVVIVDINNNSTGVNVNINVDSMGVNEEKSTQSKVKKSKEYIIDDDNAHTRVIENKQKVSVEVSADLTQVNSQSDADSDDYSMLNQPSADLGDLVEPGAVPGENGEKGISLIETYYAANVLRKAFISSKDMQSILSVYEKGYPVDFVIRCIDIGCERYRKANNGKLGIKSFNYFVPIIEEEWAKQKIRETANKIQPNELKTENKSYGHNYKLTKFHNFEQRTSKYTAEELDRIAREKFEKRLKKLNSG